MWDRVIEASPYLLVIVAFLMVRVLRVLTAHQQKMTELLNRSAGEPSEVSALRREIAELKSIVYRQAIDRDSPVPAAPPEIADGLKANG